MTRMTQSFRKWLFTYYKEIFALVVFGHTELVTEEMWKEYIEWCQTDEGKKYLKGGSEYKEEKE